MKRTTDTVRSRNLIAMSCVRKIIKLKSAKNFQKGVDNRIFMCYDTKR